MHTLTNISPELEQRVKDAHELLAEELKGLFELSLGSLDSRSIRFVKVVRAYSQIISDLPITESDRYSFKDGFGEIYLFKDDSRNAKLLLETSFGFNVAWVADVYISPPSQDEKPDELREAALRVLPERTIGIETPPLIIPNRYDNLSIRKYGRHLGFYNRTDEVLAMFETIKSLEIQSNIPKPK